MRLLAWSSDGQVRSFNFMNESSLSEECPVVTDSLWRQTPHSSRSTLNSIWKTRFWSSSHTYGPLLFGAQHQYIARDVWPHHSPRSSDAEKLLRESSIRSNRRIKFIDCLSKDDVNISACSFKLSLIMHLRFHK